MKLADCKRGMELRPFKKYDRYPLCGMLTISEVVNPTDSNDPRIAGIRFEGIHGTFRPECFVRVKKADELEEGDFFLCSIGYKHKVLARAYDEYAGLMKYFTRELKNNSIDQVSEKFVERGTILQEEVE